MYEVKTRLAKAMEIRGMNATELAKRSGLSAASISRYLNGLMFPKQSATYALAQALDVSPAWLLGFDVTIDGKHLSIDLDRLSDENRTRLFAYYQALLDTQGGK